MTLHPIPVEATGSRGGQVLTPRGIVDVAVPTYPISTEARRLRSLRVGIIGLRDMAGRLGLRAAQLSDLETGKATLPMGEWLDLLLFVETEVGR